MENALRQHYARMKEHIFRRRPLEAMKAIDMPYRYAIYKLYIYK